MSMRSTPSIARSLNFSWVIEGEVAGCAAPMSDSDLTYLRSEGIRAIVRLAYPGRDDFVIESSAVEAAGIRDLAIPVEDFHAPTQAQIEQAISFIDAHRDAGEPVAISCGAGCGRTGTILASYLVARGYSARDALTEVISKRPCSAEILERTPAQEDAIRRFARRRSAVKTPARR
jgi:atypical dual specificity phosphatase